jgi:pimeloyl-ACP methyl ester carboxylesterase
VKRVSINVPHRDILDIIDDFPKEIEEIAFGRRFCLSPDQIFVIGGSFGGAAAILASLDPQVKRVIANCPVVDWKILDRLSDHFKSGQRLSLQNRPTRSGRNICVLPCYSLSRQV